ncbi:DNA (cytosine-5-)-methyltransferase [Methanobrevibacter sp. DSM 116169]|uniref:DNA (cytosine-5-)-methyltransferase n=1 Tax=Methanobrevibacter sp. DSM 116169 TaxID=3242727 RepID=UPI0038FC372F
MEKKVVELFAGVGGFRCGLNQVKLENNQVIEENNWDFVWANQWEPSTKTQPAFECYIERFGESETHINEDIGTIDKETIPNHTLLVGGFPCQDYSVARSLSGEQGIEGKKGVLWWEIAEVLEVKRPPFVLLENVDRLLRSPSSQRGRDFGVMLRTFLNNGYSIEWRVINAGEYGFPQKRRRVFIFAYHETTDYYKKMDKKSLPDIVFDDGIFAKDFPINTTPLDKGKTIITKDKYKDLVNISDEFDFHFFNSGIMKKGKIYTAKTEPKTITISPLKDVLETNKVDEKYFLDDESFEKWKYLKGSKKIPRKKPNGECYNFSEGSMAFPDNLDVPARTMLTSETSVNRSSHVVKDNVTGKLRLLTPLEAERINMFPDNWTNIESKNMTEKRRYFMMGNALVVGIIKKLGKTIEKIIEEE